MLCYFLASGALEAQQELRIARGPPIPRAIGPRSLLGIRASSRHSLCSDSSLTSLVSAAMHRITTRTANGGTHTRWFGLSLLDLHDDALAATLARARLADHCALAATCKRVRRVMRAKALSVVRDRDGWTEYGIFAIAATQDDPDQETSTEHLKFCCVSHTFDASCTSFVDPPNVGADGVPQAPVELVNPTAAVSEEGLLVVAGGWDEKADEFGRDVCVYDSRTLSWLSRPMLRARRLPEQFPAPIASTCIAFVQGRLVIAGGQSDKRAPEPHGGALSTSNCFVWDDCAALWEQLPPMLLPTEGAAYGVIGHRLYVVGGTSMQVEEGGTVLYLGPATRRMPSLQILDMETRSWSKGPELDALHVISPRSERDVLQWHTREWSACGWRGRLYVVGCEPGYAHEDGAMHEETDWYNEDTEVYCFDPATNSWSTLPPLRFAMREGAGLCVHNGRLVVFGQGRPVEAEEFRRPMHCLIHYLADDNTWKAWAHSGSNWIWTLPHFDPPKFHIMASPWNQLHAQTVVSLPLR